MTFRLETTKSVYNKREKQELEKLGFSFEWDSKDCYFRRGEPEYDIATFKDFKEFCEKWGCVVVCPCEDGGHMWLRIYDDYD